MPATVASRAEGVGFEPTRGLPLVAFKATALVHYANPPSAGAALQRETGLPAPCTAHLSVLLPLGGVCGIRTRDRLLAKQKRYQLRQDPSCLLSLAEMLASHNRAVVALPGFEPGTSRSGGERSIR